MENKAVVDGQPHSRPYLIALIDRNNSNIFWAVPISSQYEKYQRKYKYTIQKYGKCNTIRFGKLMGNPRVFLLQNMCPIIEDYIDKPYLDGTGNPVHISSKLNSNISYNAYKILQKEMHGVKLTYPNITEMYATLQKQLMEKMNFEIYETISPKREKIPLSANKIQSICENWIQKYSHPLQEFSETADTEDVEF